MNIKHTVFTIAIAFLGITECCAQKIDRYAVVSRNTPHICAIDTMASLSVGNGEFAFTADVTGLQTFPRLYSNGVPLGTQAQWGWHTFPNTLGAKSTDALNKDGYSCQKKSSTSAAIVDWLRANPHRLHLGCIRFADIKPTDISDINQVLNLWEGIINSEFTYKNRKVNVQTSCDPKKDMVAFHIKTSARIPVTLSFPYPKGGHSDDACNWDNDSHTTEIISFTDKTAIIKRQIDNDIYYAKLSWTNAKKPFTLKKNVVQITPTKDEWTLCVEFTSEKPSSEWNSAELSQQLSKEYWKEYWTEGGIVDFGECTDPRAKELERRVILSQYLTAIQCAGSTPPQETGLTYNSWFGKFHLEMTWWHEAHFALWGHENLLARTLPWYKIAVKKAKEIAQRQGYEGVRWMKMTDPTGEEAPSDVGSFLIWQQPHLIYMLELLYRAKPSQDLINEYYDLVEKSAEFMVSFLKYDEAKDRYYISGVIPAQETLKAETTINPPFELSYWHFGLSLAQQWRMRYGKERNAKWDEILSKLSHLAAQDGLYLAAESATDTYTNINMTSDHMAVLAALGVLPDCPLLDKTLMLNTWNWVYANWNWNKTWGWDYPVTAMCAVRLGEPEKAIDALLMDKTTNTYLPNGHNYQTSRLRCYLPGNGGLLTTVALMCAGYDGCTTKNPGFPHNGKWNVKWENLKPMP